MTVAAFESNDTQIVRGDLPAVIRNREQNFAGNVEADAVHRQTTVAINTSDGDYECS